VIVGGGAIAFGSSSIGPAVRTEVAATTNAINKAICFFIALLISSYTGVISMRSNLNQRATQDVAQWFIVNHERLQIRALITVPQQRSNRRLLDRSRCTSCAGRSPSHRPCIRSAALRKRKPNVPAPRADLRSSKELVLLRLDNSCQTGHDSPLFEPPSPVCSEHFAAVSGTPRRKGQRAPAMCISSS
jgi:hypothetical protein